MVARSGFYIKNGTVHRQDVEIAWNLGFDRIAKEVYVTELILELTKIFPDKLIAEVTSASIDKRTRQLSPIFVRHKDGRTLEDMYQSYNKELLAHQMGIDVSFLFPHFYCTNAAHMLPTIRLYDIFTDVFYNPTKSGGTQAEACAFLKLLEEENKLTILSDPPKFQRWCEDHIAYRR